MEFRTCVVSNLELISYMCLNPIIDIHTETRIQHILLQTFNILSSKLAFESRYPVVCFRRYEYETNGTWIKSQSEPQHWEAGTSIRQVSDTIKSEFWILLLPTIDLYQCFIIYKKNIWIKLTNDNSQEKAMNSQ